MCDVKTHEMVSKMPMRLCLIFKKHAYFWGMFKKNKRDLLSCKSWLSVQSNLRYVILCGITSKLDYFKKPYCSIVHIAGIDRDYLVSVKYCAPSEPAQRCPLSAMNFLSDIL